MLKVASVIRLFGVVYESTRASGIPSFAFVAGTIHRQVTTLSQEVPQILKTRVAPGPTCSPKLYKE